MWIIIKTLVPALSPCSVTCDFEQAFLNSTKKHFSNISVHGCFFHMTQCVWRKIQKREEILQNYSQEPDFALNVKKLCSLAFVPPEDVVSRYEVLMDTQFYVDNENLLKPLLEYFEKVWIGSLVTRGNRVTRRNPTFAYELWNCYDRTLNRLPRTNNNCEGHNNALKCLMGGTHLNLGNLFKT